MEDDKKKRNKKKKKKQTKTTEDDLAVGVDQNGVIHGKNDHNRVIDLAAEVQNGAVQNADMGLDRHQNNGTETSIILSEAEKQQWLQREAILKETIRQLQNDNGSHIQKEANLEERIQLLEKENDSERQKQAMFEEAIQQLRNEKYSHTQKEAGLEKKIVQLQSEKELSLQKEVHMEEKLQHLMNEKAILDIKAANLEEKVKLLESDKNSLTLTETATRETIAGMNVDITRLRMQVVELEESRNSLMKKNQQLMENISGLQLQLQNLETNIALVSSSDETKKHASEHEEKDSQIEAACALVDKLISENAELIEKVNGLYIKLDRQRSAAGLSSAVASDLIVGNAGTTSSSGDISIPESSEPIVDQKLEALEVEPAAGVAYAAEADSGEIVQIPLDDNELRDLELQAGESDKMGPVPISDAPLIGAPFRLISFVAKYVSGADLVDIN